MSFRLPGSQDYTVPRRRFREGDHCARMRLRPLGRFAIAPSFPGRPKGISWKHESFLGRPKGISWKHESFLGRPKGISWKHESFPGRPKGIF